MSQSTDQPIISSELPPATLALAMACFDDDRGIVRVNEDFQQAQREAILRFVATVEADVCNSLKQRIGEWTNSLLFYQPALEKLRKQIEEAK